MLSGSSGLSRAHSAVDAGKIVRELVRLSEGQAAVGGHIPGHGAFAEEFSGTFRARVCRRGGVLARSGGALRFAEEVLALVLPSTAGGLLGARGSEEVQVAELARSAVGAWAGHEGLVLVLHARSLRRAETSRHQVFEL